MTYSFRPWPRTSASEISALCFQAQAATNDLEMQNDVLRRAQAELDVQARYFDLYDLAQFVYVATHGLQSALQNIKYVLKETRGTIIYGEMPLIVADEPQMTQLFQNLIGTALIYYGEEAPRSEISAVREGNYSRKLTLYYSTLICPKMTDAKEILVRDSQITPER
jgi:light-regulated signal transduction histidine kinase (bacteriophytochrome)